MAPEDNRNASGIETDSFEKMAILWETCFLHIFTEIS